MKLFCLALCAMFSVQTAIAGVLGGRTVSEGGKPVSGARIALLPGNYGAVSRKGDGAFRFSAPPGRYRMTVRATGFAVLEDSLTVADSTLFLTIRLSEKVYTTGAVTVTGSKDNTFGITNMGAVEGAGIYEAKKTEVITLVDMLANKSTNNARQIFSKIAGLNIWESDGAGLQLGVGGRGLSPNRTANFNTRQNGYDISADALGYPESYYTPPVEALERIEIVRGAASLQYGTQFGGLLNFIFKKGAADKELEIITRQTAGSFGLFSSFNSVGGTVGTVNYYGFYQYKRGDGWRPNSGFDVHTGFVSAQWQPNENFSAGVEWTLMKYLAQQPGGLTDKQFEDDPRRSFRARNWFKVDWQIAAATAQYRFSPETRLDTRFFGVFASRQSLGNLERINVADLPGNRSLIQGEFRNFGNETRVIHTYELFHLPANLVVGFRLYDGRTTQRQGEGDAGSGANFTFLHPNDLEGSDYAFPGKNYAVFAENIFRLSEQFSIVPGVRWENIQTFADGYYKQRVTDFAGNIISDTNIREGRSDVRSFALFGIGASFRPNDEVELYANFSQNYRSITFSDIRVVNPNYSVDSNLQDERGFNADVGARGRLAGGAIYFDATVFYLSYSDRIGLLLKSGAPPLYLPYRFRTNIADSRSIGAEALAEADILALVRGERREESSASLFVNFSAIDAKYVNTDDLSIRDKDVELVPPMTLRTGVTVRFDDFRASTQYSFVARHFTDATNAVRTSTAVNGEIPAYGVADLSAAYSWGDYTIEAGVNNLLDAMYFTRRAESYPGPGIIPSDGRSFYVTVQARLAP